MRLAESCCHSDTSGKPSANAGEKNSQMNQIIVIIERGLIKVASNNICYIRTKRNKHKQKQGNRIRKKSKSMYIISEKPTKLHT